MFGATHLERAAVLATDGASVASILVVVDPLWSELWGNERFTSWTARVGACEALVMARRGQMNRHFGPNQVGARTTELGLPSKSGSDEDDPNYRSAIFDAIVAEHELSALLDILDQVRERCRYEFDDENDKNDGHDDPRGLDADEPNRKWMERRRELIAPRPLVEHRRRYLLPAPLDHWDRRNRVQQWYFVATAEGITYWQGGSGSSGQRENHGRWAHVFGALSAHHTIAAPTVVLRYDGENSLRFVTQSPTLLVDEVDLVGNYAVDPEVSRALLKNFTINTRGFSNVDQFGHDG